MLDFIKLLVLGAALTGGWWLIMYSVVWLRENIKQEKSGGCGIIGFLIPVVICVVSRLIFLIRWLYN